MIFRREAWAKLLRFPRPLLRCGLAMAGAHLWETQGANEDRCPGVVTGMEMLDMNLHGTKLVTLSACAKLSFSTLMHAKTLCFS